MGTGLVGIILLLTVSQCVLAAFCQSFFYHRYASHRHCTMSAGAERGFFILTWIALGPGYMTVWVYAVMHRLHHKHSDTDDDPHPAHLGIFGMLRGMVAANLAISQGKYAYLPGDEPIRDAVRRLPRWDWFERIAASYWMRAAWAFLYFGVYWVLGLGGWWYGLLVLNVFMGPIHGFAINYFGHFLGYRNHETNDTSTNIGSRILPYWMKVLLSLLLGGEEKHNNHHDKQGRPNFAHTADEVDTTFAAMRLLDRLGIIRLRPSPAS